MIPIALPLNRSVNRCLAYGHAAGEQCERRDDCATHQTIKHDVVPVPAVYRKCSTDLMVGFVPMAGFPDRDEVGA